MFGLKINLPGSVGDFSKIPGRQELSGKNIDDFKRPMNQNLSHSSGAQITAKHFRKTGSSARIDRIILGLKINIKNTLQHFLKYEVEKFYREAQWRNG